MKKLLSFCCALMLMASGAAHAEGESNALTIPQTGYTTPVPAVYSTPAEHQGTIEWITYDSEDYLNGNVPVQKTAAVYLPYGYDENDLETRYDILYLMHGWGGSAGEYFQRGSSVTAVKNMLDHMIENGEIKPIIAVSATFYNENSARDFGSSEDALREFQGASDARRGRKVPHLRGFRLEGGSGGFPGSPGLRGFFPGQRNHLDAVLL